MSVRTSRSRAALLSAGAAALALTLSACAGGGIEGGGGGTGFVTGSDGIATVEKGDRDDAPALSGKTIDGDQLDVSSAYKGKIIVLNVWGSWCAPCRAEAPNLVKVSEDLADQGVQFVGINTRDTSTRPAVAFEEQYKVDYPSLYDPTGKLLLRFEKGSLNPQLIPSTLVVDRDGKLAARTQQALSEEKLRKMLKPILAEK
ncbi:TlpA family protein disulfide reductase [Streptomyces europaeiscabiei]|uniref:TlpA disulfide reductase family protein n=2 Tax=Streptomyces europaeiscabiei TaxID=146819 RepID=A0ABU4NVY0_9ACTN|nr:TlpA disulfide reductase family protein [Streptomyces europaeiscabiei]MDX2530744.1 TlpA disulfide reductase family protein [Streptomyces europaeiscabiei]MDX2775008.1 TlpA disulfide reductase family protein [Streptomyces europaeiscabiei]MDX3548709.1 TlpA disulfide reductase family protein [Streptomyces europaeiscabiei]MDX3558122.1 TlpA disulfide reductase family protein [Streptomyces europaeiscabiei]MDX3671614.1 TlpA disulfide reductase family protein [Streptomyces europaeiscabiei]